MTRSSRSPDDFTDADWLRLLQLQARRAMLDRQAPDVETPTAIPGAVGDRVNLERWTLVPEGVSLYDWQRQCLEKWLALGRGTVKVATGGGKTLFALAAAQTIQNQAEPDLRLVIVVPTIPLMNQWYEELLKGSIPAAAIGLMGAGRAIPPADTLRILVCVINSARDKLPAFVAGAGWGSRMLLVVDECHRAGADQAQRIFESKPRYTLGLSATPEQEGEDEAVPTDTAYAQSIIGQALGPIIFDFTLRMSLEAGLLTPFEVWHVALPLGPDESVKYGELSREITELRKGLQAVHARSRSKQGFIEWCQTRASRGGDGAIQAERFIGLANSRKHLLYQASSRTAVVLGLLSEAAADSDSRAIVFHERIEEIEFLFRLAVQANLPVVLEHSKLPDGLRTESIEAFRKGIARAIISAKSLIEGFNVPSADLGIIAASSSSVRQRIQSLGRMLRRKVGARTARIIVLYMADTEDEAIYEKADWESVIGVDRNRYFRWEPTESAAWPSGLVEVGQPPRSYRPPSSSIDADNLKPGTRYPGQTKGLDLKVDQSDNLRDSSGSLIPAPKALVAQILAFNPYRRARRTPAGHVIVRADSSGEGEPDWRFLGVLELPEEEEHARTITRYAIVTVSGRRYFSTSAGRSGSRFARGPAQAKDAAAGTAHDDLLAWIRGMEGKRGVKIKDLYWDGTRYWVEIQGERVEYPGALPSLEFSS